MENLSSEQILDVVKKIAKEKVRPRASEIDETDKFPCDVYNVFKETGIFALIVPQKYGGLGLPFEILCPIIEEIAKASASCASLPFGQGTLISLLLEAGTKEQKEHYLPSIAKGDLLGALAITESHGGSDVSSIKTKTNFSIEGSYYLINGSKCFITNGGEAHLYIVLASNDPKKKREGLSIFLVEKNTEGFFFGKEEKKMGMRGIPNTDLIFHNVKVFKNNLVGEEGGGFKILVNLLNKTRILIGAWAVGIAQGAIDYAIHYAKNRVQFGHPISEYQAIQFMISDMATQTQAARCLVEYAAHKLRLNAAEVPILSSMAKYFPTDVAMKVTTDAVQILGGYGYIKDHPLERMMRDAKALQILEGTNQIQRITVAHHLFKRY